MRVLINCLSATSGGAISYLRNISRPLYLQFSNNSKHFLFFLVFKDQLEFLDIPTENIILINGKRPLGVFRVLWEIFCLPRIVADYDISVLFTPYQVGFSIPNIKNVLMIRNMEPFLFFKYKYSFNTWLRNKVLAVASNYCLRKADRIVAVSNFAAAHLARISIPDQATSQIYHGSPSFSEISTDDLLRLSSIGIDHPFVMACGSILPYRRYEDVIHAFNSALPSIPDNITLVIAGSGSDKFYNNMLIDIISCSPHPERIFMLGSVNWSNMELLYRNSLSCIIASEIEACPNIAIEAMSSGSCILAADIPPLPEIFDGCAIMYPPRNIPLLSNCIVRSILDNNMRREFRMLSRQRSFSFSWSMSSAMTYDALTNWDNY